MNREEREWIKYKSNDPIHQHDWWFKGRRVNISRKYIMGFLKSL